MAFIGSILGAGQGSDWVAPTDQNQAIVNPVTGEQTTKAYEQTQQGLQYQNDFVKATQAQQGLANQTAALNAQQGLASQLAAQNGVGNQSSVFNQQQDLASALAGQNSVQTQSAALQAQQALAQQQQGLIGQQQGTASQLQGVADGSGPNPAQAQLAQSTGNNIAQQAALMAGQRGASANAGLIARQAAMQGGAIQQQAAGQAATLQAQQSLSALGQLGAQQQAIGATQQAIGNTNNAVAGIASNQTQAQQAQQQQLAALASQQVGQQANQQNAVAGLATQQVGQQQNAVAGYNQAAQGSQANLFGAIGNSNSSQAALQGNQNTNNTAIQVQNSKAQQGIFGGLLGGAGSILAHGGVVGHDENEKTNTKSAKAAAKAPAKKMADGGMTDDGTAPMTFSAPPPPAMRMAVGGVTPASPNGPQSFAGRFFSGANNQYSGGPASSAPGYNGGGGEGANPIASGGSQFVGKVLNNYVVPAIKSAFAPAVDKAGIGSQFNASPEPTLGVEGIQAPVDPNAASLGVDTSLGESGVPADSFGVFDTGAAAEGAEGAATAGEAAEGAEALEGAAAAGEAAEGGEGLTSLVALLNKGGETNAGTKLKHGGKVPGKAKVPGDSVKNDTVNAKLSPEEIVIPRSIVKSADPVGNAAKFVQALLTRQTLRKGAK